MKRYACLLSLVLCALAISAHAASPGSAEAVVQAQLDAYNAHDIDAFLATYSDDIELYGFPATLRTKGKQAMRAIYAPRFLDQTLHAAVPQRITMGNTVIDREHVRAMFPDGPGTIDAVAIYEVRHGKIAKVTFIVGATTPDHAATAKP
jgi:hypothetical protein